MSHREDGINAKVGSAGSRFSGGEKQRLALARAFIKMPKVLILDEATSALDKKNERDVQQAIEDMKKELGGVTTVVIAHRLSTIENADKILVMVKGQLVEEGSHQELLSKYPDGVYAGLVKTQKGQDDHKDK
jgi:ABC-type multidrug transport system fused ATPase/permease subunit